jgi:hypothetical protein
MCEEISEENVICACLARSGFNNTVPALKKGTK